MRDARIIYGGGGAFCFEFVEVMAFFEEGLGYELEGVVGVAGHGGNNLRILGLERMATGSPSFCAHWLMEGTVVGVLGYFGDPWRRKGAASSSYADF